MRHARWRRGRLSRAPQARGKPANLGRRQETRTGLEPDEKHRKTAQECPHAQYNALAWHTHIFNLSPSSVDREGTPATESNSTSSILPTLPRNRCRRHSHESVQFSPRPFPPRTTIRVWNRGRADRTRLTADWTNNFAGEQGKWAAIVIVFGMPSSSRDRSRCAGYCNRIGGAATRRLPGHRPCRYPNLYTRSQASLSAEGTPMPSRPPVSAAPAAAIAAPRKSHSPERPNGAHLRSPTPSRCDRQDSRLLERCGPTRRRHPRREGQHRRIR